ncbi:hypothetical protein F5Y19DRAFT_475926 [Xylariaceae sp. FL1651]|nr:hypothetical protein F5Y19DRAFT_475926 [Xylariaceae sp. FL1651]
MPDALRLAPIASSGALTDRCLAQSSTTWHPISQMPLTELKIWSITTFVYDLDDWEETWVESHGREWTWDLDDDEIPEGTKYGSIPNYNLGTDWWV